MLISLKFNCISIYSKAIQKQLISYILPINSESSTKVFIIVNYWNWQLKKLLQFKQLNINWKNELLLQFTKNNIQVILHSARTPDPIFNFHCIDIARYKNLKQNLVSTLSVSFITGRFGFIKSQKKTFVAKDSAISGILWIIKTHKDIIIPIKLRLVGLISNLFKHKKQLLIFLNYINNSEIDKLTFQDNDSISDLTSNIVNCVALEKIEQLVSNSKLANIQKLLNQANYSILAILESTPISFGLKKLKLPARTRKRFHLYNYISGIKRKKIGWSLLNSKQTTKFNIWKAIAKMTGWRWDLTRWIYFGIRNKDSRFITQSRFIWKQALHYSTSLIQEWWLDEIKKEKRNKRIIIYQKRLINKKKRKYIPKKFVKIITELINIFEHINKCEVIAYKFFRDLRKFHWDGIVGEITQLWLKEKDTNYNNFLIFYMSPKSKWKCQKLLMNKIKNQYILDIYSYRKQTERYQKQLKELYNGWSFLAANKMPAYLLWLQRIQQDLNFLYSNVQHNLKKNRILTHVYQKRYKNLWKTKNFYICYSTKTLDQINKKTKAVNVKLVNINQTLKTLNIQLYIYVRYSKKSWQYLSKKILHKRT